MNNFIATCMTVYLKRQNLSYSLILSLETLRIKQRTLFQDWETWRYMYYMSDLWVSLGLFNSAFSKNVINGLSFLNRTLIMKMTGNFSPFGLEQKISVKFVQTWYDCSELCLFLWGGGGLINFMTSLHITLLVKLLVI